MISADVARNANLIIHPTYTELRNASNGVMNLLGEADTVMCNDRHSTQLAVLVSADLGDSALISWQDLQKLHVIPASFPAVAAVAAVARCFQDLKTKTLSDYSAVFSDTLDDKPMCAQRLGIYLKDKVTPYRVLAPRPYHYASKRQHHLKSPSTLLLASLPHVMNPLIGVRLHSSSLRGMANVYDW